MTPSQAAFEFFEALWSLGVEPNQRRFCSTWSFRQQAHMRMVRRPPLRSLAVE